MTKIIQTQNVSLDTSFFEQNNFLVGAKIKELTELCQNGTARIFLTDITYREVIARFLKNLLTAEEKIKKPKETLATNAKVLRNFPEMKVFFELPSIEVESLALRFNVEFEEWLKRSKAIIIPTDSITIKEVFDDYFKNNPPFKEGEKKNEFPDAFTLKALVDYFSIRGEKSYIISSDKDILTKISEAIIPIEDTSVLFDLLIRSTIEKGEDSVIELIEEAFINSKVKLGAEVRVMIKNAIEDEVGLIHNYRGIRIDSVVKVDVSDIVLNNFSIVLLNTTNHLAKLDSEINFSFEVFFSAYDEFEEMHDHKDDNLRIAKPKTYRFTDTYYIPITIEAKVNTVEKVAKLKVEDINNGKGLDVMSSFKF